MDFFRIFVYLLLTATCVINCGIRGNKSFSYLDKEIVRDNCFSCHAPHVDIEGGQLSGLYRKYKKKKLKKYLKREFLIKKKTNTVHENIVLNEKEIESIMLYLKSI